MPVFEFKGLTEFNAAIDAMVEAVNFATRDGVVKGVAVIEASAKTSFGPGHAKGTPKTVFGQPQSISGTLRRSIKMVGEPVEVGRGVWSARVGPTSIYGRRVELGFNGSDALGRVYNQAPNPYLKPGVDKSIPLLNAVFESSWAAAMKV